MSCSYLGRMISHSNKFLCFLPDTVLHRALVGDWYKFWFDTLLQIHRKLSIVPSNSRRTNHHQLIGL